MSQITLSATKLGLIKKIAGNKLDSQLFDANVEHKLKELIELSGVPDSHLKFEVEPAFKKDGLYGQIGCLSMGDQKLVIYIMEGHLNSATAVDALVELTTRFTQYVQQHHAFAVTIGKITDISAATLIQFHGSKLVELDRTSSIASRSAFVVQGGVLVNIAKVIAETLSSYGDQHHLLTVQNTLQECLDWSFQGIETEMGLLKN